MLLLNAVYADMGDKVLRFSTPGPDCYADGTIVRDGECYTLVWSPTGTTFSGFNADGTPVSSNDRVVLAGALAQGGRCRDAVFQIPAKEYEALEGGEWAVCLVDTRRVDGVPAGVQDGKPMRVNRWGLVGGPDNVRIEPDSVSALRAFAAPKAAKRLLLAATDDAEDDIADGDGGVCAAKLSSVPATAKNPKIASLYIKDGVVRLTVEDTEPYLTYGIASGETPSALNADENAGVADGETGAEIEFEADASGGSRFFKVIRAE